MKRSIRFTFIAILISLFGSTAVLSAQADSNNPNNWVSLGSLPVNGWVPSIAINSSGDAYVSSNFSQGLGWPKVDMIAKWDGAVWSFLGTETLNGPVNTIAISETDEVYIGGVFRNASNNPNADYIVKWNGSSWSALGTTPLSDEVYSIAVDGNEVYAGGFFTNAGGDPNADRIAKWNGSSWSALGAPFSANVFSIVIDKTTSDVYAGGGFTNVGGNPNIDYIAKWDGSFWSSLGTTPLNSSVWDIAISETGDIYAAGNFTNAGGDPNADYIARWNGTNWSALGTPPTTPKLYDLYGRAIAIRGDEVYVGFSTGGGPESAMFIAKWDGFTWSDPAATKLGYNVFAIAIYDTQLYAGGGFTNAGENPNADYIAMVELPAPSSIYVTNTRDNGPGSLRQAIAQVANGGTVTFAPTLAGQTIHLSSPIVIDKGVIIDGSGLSSHVRISGDTDNNGTGDVAVFQIGGPSPVELNHITITKGKSTGTTGGGGIANYGTLMIRNSIISDNTYISGLGGGGIYNNGDLTILDSDITGNTALEGGGVFNELNKSLTITRVTFSNNSALTSPGQPGGAAGAIGNIGTLTVSDSVFTNNLSQGGGGAIVNSIQGNTTISNSSFTGNTTSGKGGAIVNFEGVMTVENCTFADNSAYGGSSHGGAIYNEDQITIAGGAFTENTASYGGAIASIAQLNVSNSSISTNTAELGGGIYNEGSITIASADIHGNTATTGGGGIANNWTDPNTATITNSTISGNTSPNGAGIHNLSANGTVNISNSTLSSNTATGNGGGISNFGVLKLTNTTLFNNSAAYGGGIFSLGTLTIGNGTIYENSASTNGGGVANFGTLSYTNTIIANSLSGSDCYNSGGSLSQNINNLVENNSPSPNQCGTPTLALDPQLGPLTDNGGSTQTMALLPDSPAINAGDDATCEETDQRGIARSRSQEDHCDIGSYEYVSDAQPFVSSIARDNISPANTANVNFTVTFSEDVTGVDANGSDFSLTTTGLTGASIISVIPISASVYTASINTGSGNGTIRLDVSSDATIKDLANNNLTGLPYTSGETYIIQKDSAPTDLALSPNSVDENQPSGTTLGTFSTTDPDIGDTFTYSFCGGTNDDSFSISGNTLKTAAMFDYEAKSSYSICIRSMDNGGLSTSKNFTIRINNLVDTQTFGDVSTSYWAWQYIERLYNSGITGGCSTNPLSYCPTSPVTRAQMAVFLLKGIHGSSFAPPAVGASTGFTDVDVTHWAAAWIKQLAAESITGGCGSGVYCPETTVTRAQMAIFLLKAMHGSAYSPPPATGSFSDVPVGYWAAAWIEQLAAEGITSGCAAGLYCPENPVTRDQMAVFLVKAFNLP